MIDKKMIKIKVKNRLSGILVSANLFDVLVLFVKRNEPIVSFNAVEPMVIKNQTVSNRTYIARFSFGFKFR